MDIANNLGKVNVVVDALSRRPAVCDVRPSAMSIQYEDQREDVADRIWNI